MNKRKNQEKVYNPYDYRKGTDLISNTESCVTLIKGSLGTGILAMPMAFNDSGYLGGVIGIIMFALLLDHCIQILFKGIYEMCKKIRVPFLSYPQAIQEGFKIGPGFLRYFSKTASVAVNVCLLICQLGICCVYLIFIGEHIKKFIDYKLKKDIDIQILLLCISPLFCALNLLKYLKILALFSSIANIFTIISLAIIVYFLVREPFDLYKRELFAPIKNYPLFFGIVLYALEAIGIIITLENNMKNPEDFPGPYGIFTITYFSVTTMYLVIGLLGYLRFGPEVKDSITLNLPEEEWLAQTAELLLVLAIIVSYALQCFVPINIIWDQYLLDRCQHLAKWKQISIENGIRIGCGLFTCGLAISIPLLQHFIALIGSLCLSMLGIIFPALLEICVQWTESSSSFDIKIYKDLVIIFIGFLAFISGSGVSIHQMIKALRKKNLEEV